MCWPHHIIIISPHYSVISNTVCMPLDLSLISVAFKHSTQCKCATDVYPYWYRPILWGAVALLPLLGGTWILGLLFLINNDSVVLAWIFTIVNSLQVMYMNTLISSCQIIWCFSVIYDSLNRKPWLSNHQCCKLLSRVCIS